MWLFTTFGFFSIHVPDYGTPRPWLREVRARRQEDLDRLRERYCPGLGPTLETPEADYPFRAIADAVMLAGAMHEIVKDIEYSNFKVAIEDHDRDPAYINVWAGLREELDDRFKVGRRRRRNAKAKG